MKEISETPPPGKKNKGYGNLRLNKPSELLFISHSTERKEFAARPVPLVSQLYAPKMKTTMLDDGQIVNVIGRPVLGYLINYQRLAALI
ncbi:hypothetical protein C5167_042666 [Papaver somniferum]|uniref:Uncharacterized protein n=1 Tax=Papaver somniferum TaxID=3469 RepID=A0A4Y7L6T4_PAPSO|nr:hypothetical protein C5167_042666 [Papaver somniferum]